MRSTMEIDRVLKAATDRGGHTGSCRDGGDARGAGVSRRVRPPRAPRRHPDDRRHRLLDCLDDEGDHLGGGDARCWSRGGKLALDRPIAEVLPELASPQVLDGFDAAGEPKLRPAKRPITLRHLDHPHRRVSFTTSGTPEMGRYMEKRGIPGIISCQNAALNLPLVFEPGEKWDYGINIDWVGKAVERVSGQLLGDYFAEHIFGPIGMRDTGFKLTPESRTRLAGMARARVRWRARANRLRDPAGTGVPDGRRRALRHGGRLPCIPARLSQ